MREINVTSKEVRFYSNGLSKIFLQDMSLCESSSIIKKLLVGGLFVQQLTKPRSILPNTYYTEVGNTAQWKQNLSEFAINDFRNFFTLSCATSYDTDSTMENLFQQILTN